MTKCPHCGATGTSPAVVLHKETCKTVESQVYIDTGRRKGLR
jgi:hypothetical protein